MPRLIPAAERLVLARALIQKAHEVVPPIDGGKFEFSYIAQVKDFLRLARDLVKFIPQSAGASAEIKKDALRVLQEADQADREILH